MSEDQNYFGCDLCSNPTDNIERTCGECAEHQGELRVLIRKERDRLRSEKASLQARIAELEAQLKWKDIGDAPPIDGSEFLATDGHDVFIVCFHREGFALTTLGGIIDGGGSPSRVEPRYPHITMWMFKPTPPTQEGDKE